MSAVSPAAGAASQQAVVEAALVLLERMGLSPADLATEPRDRTVVPTFAEYVPMVSAAVSAGTRRAYGTYWNRIIDQWGDRRLGETVRWQPVSPTLMARLVQHGQERHAPADERLRAEGTAARGSGGTRCG